MLARVLTDRCKIAKRKMLNGCGVLVPRVFSSSCNIPGSVGGQSEAPTTQQTRADGLIFRLPAEEDNEAEEKQALRARLFSRLCVNRLRGSTCRAVSDKVGGYQSGRLWATLSTHWRVQPVCSHLTGRHFQLRRPAFSVLLPMGGLLFVQASHKFIDFLPIFLFHDGTWDVCLDQKRLEIYVNKSRNGTRSAPAINISQIMNSFSACSYLK